MNILAPLRGADFDAAPLPGVRVLCAPLGPPPYGKRTLKACEDYSLITLPGEYKKDKNNHNDCAVYQFPGKVISSETRRQPGH